MFEFKKKIKKTKGDVLSNIVFTASKILHKKYSHRLRHMVFSFKGKKK